jgi:ABC-type multidrug transport system fused ATPase/permease subunit
VQVKSSTSELPKLILKLWFHLNWRRRFQFLILIVLMLVSAIAEVVSIGAVMPFIGILTAPDVVIEYPLIKEITIACGVSTAIEMVFLLTLAFIVVTILAGIIRIILLWYSSRLAFASGADIGIEVYRRTLYQPYWVNVSRNSSDVISGITNKVNGVVFGVLLPLLTLISSSMLLVAISLAFLTINPMVATIATLGFGSSYLLIIWVSRKKLTLNSKLIAKEQTQVIKALQEGLGGIRDVQIDGTQPIYCEIFKIADQSLRRAQSSNAFIGQSPRYIMEALGMILIASLAYILSLESGGIAASLPVLGALAIGAQRLLPALQQSYSAWASITGSHASLADTVDLLDQPLPTEYLNKENKTSLQFEKFIQFKDVYFRYEEERKWVVDGLNILIPKGSRLGIIGNTGSGKSTMLDLLMGLLVPTSGEIIVDDQVLTGKKIRAWQNNIAHVPQTIYLADATIAENVAFGVPVKFIDMTRVQAAVRQAQLLEFIESNPDKYQARVGERGIQLSGGQRQRIGIARALYKQAKVLVFDEATSALDNNTEQSVMDAIDRIDSNITIIMIAHRLTTLKSCDKIVEIKEGKLIEHGAYKDLT